jgi:hypothetical protein
LLQLALGDHKSFCAAADSNPIFYAAWLFRKASSLICRVSVCNIAITVNCKVIIITHCTPLLPRGANNGFVSSAARRIPLQASQQPNQTQYTESSRNTHYILLHSLFAFARPSERERCGRGGRWFCSRKCRSRNQEEVAAVLIQFGVFAAPRAFDSVCCSVSNMIHTICFVPMLIARRACHLFASQSPAETRGIHCDKVFSFNVRVGMFWSVFEALGSTRHRINNLKDTHTKFFQGLVL